VAHHVHRVHLTHIAREFIASVSTGRPQSNALENRSLTALLHLPIRDPRKIYQVSPPYERNRPRRPCAASRPRRSLPPPSARANRREMIIRIASTPRRASRTLASSLAPRAPPLYPFGWVPGRDVRDIRLRVGIPPHASPRAAISRANASFERDETRTFHRTSHTRTARGRSRDRRAGRTPQLHRRHRTRRSA